METKQDKKINPKMLFQSLSRLPFVCAFDMFRHEGIPGGLQRIFTSGTELFEFMETVFGNGHFGKTIRACHLVFSLECPADALYLLHPVDKTIPESVGAWSVATAHSDAYWILPVRRDLMIRAVRVFLPHGPVYDWLHSSDFATKLTMQQWVEFAREFIYDHRFTANWWKEHEWWESETMGIAILMKVEEEEERLERRLWRDECRKMMNEKMDRQALKAAQLMEEDQQEEERKKEAEEANKKKEVESIKTQGHTMKSMKSMQKKKPQILKLTDNEVMCAKSNAATASSNRSNPS
jgi:hypothetical protein